MMYGYKNHSVFVYLIDSMVILKLFLNADTHTIVLALSSFSYQNLFSVRNELLTAKLLRQGYRYHKIRKAFLKFYRRHFDIVTKYNVGLKTLLLEGLSEPEFYGDLVYKFRNIIDKNGFPYHFKKIIVRYKKIGYNLDVLRQTACLVVNPTKGNSFAYFFKCTTVGRASD